MDPKIEELRRKSERNPALLKQYQKACSLYTLEKVRDSYKRELETLQKQPIRTSISTLGDGVSIGLDVILDGDTYMVRVNKIVKLKLLLQELEKHLNMLPT